MFVLLLSCILGAQAQESIVVTGVVTDKNKEPLVGVNITVGDMVGLGTITDINGKYKIKMEPYHRLIFSYIGFDKVEVLVKEDRVMNVAMQESEASVIDEVVITGTGAQKKLTVTGAVTNVNVADLKVNPTGSISNALAGNVAGVLAMQTSGQPGQNSSEFWIRGISTFGASNAALVLVDGFERNLDEINIEDIETFVVLKDASTTAIYGSRGANGVILITTKHGKAGKINIDANLCVLCQSLHIKGFFQRCVQTVDKCNNHFCCHIETCSQLCNRAFQLCYLFAEDIFIDFLFLGQIFLPNRFNAAAFLRKCLLHPIFIQAHLLSLLLFFLFLYKLLHSFK